MKFDHHMSVELPGFPYQVYQSQSGQTVTQDTQYLLDTILERFSDPVIHVLELGSGTGILSILMKLYRPQWIVTGIEIQSHLVELSTQNALNCHTPIRFLEGDIRRINESVPEHEFDLVVGNPPYYKLGDFRLSANREKAISKHELLCSMEDILLAVAKTLKCSGSAFILYPEQRIEELKHKIKNIDLQFNTEFSLSIINDKIKDKTVIVELAYADH